MQEQAAYQQALQYVEQHRKNDVTITVHDQLGYPLKNLNVTYWQTSHDFMFGFWSFTPTDAKGWSLFSDLCEATNATILVSMPAWGDSESKRGTFDWSRNDSEFQRLLEHCHTARFVVLFMNFEPWTILPSWINAEAMSDPAVFTQFKEDLYEYVYQAVKHYSDKVAYWITDNELNLRAAQRLLPSMNKALEIVQVEVKAIREADDNAKVLLEPGYITDTPWSPVDFAKQVIQSGIRIDGFAIEAYADHTPVFYQNIINESWKTFAKPVLIQETGYPSVPEGIPNKSWNAWNHVFDEPTQAAWIKYMTVLPFGNGPFLGVLLLTAVDLQIKLQEFNHVGLFSPEGLTVKNSYYVYRQNIQMFTTKGSALTDDEGQLTFRGFAGYYTVTVTDTNGQQSNLHIHVRQLSNSTYRGQQNFIITFTSHPTVSVTRSQNLITRVTASSSQLPLTGQYLWPGTIGLLVLTVAVLVILRSIFALRKPAPRS